MNLRNVLIEKEFLMCSLKSLPFAQVFKPHQSGDMQRHLSSQNTSSLKKKKNTLVRGYDCTRVDLGGDLDAMDRLRAFEMGSCFRVTLENDLDHPNRLGSQLG